MVTHVCSPVAWIYQSEIFPLKIRTMGASAATASKYHNKFSNYKPVSSVYLIRYFLLYSGNWLFNTWISQVSPIALDNPSVGPNFFFMFMTLNYVVAGYTFLFYPETKGKTLEDIGGVLNEDIPMEKNDGGKVEEAAAGSTSSHDNK